MIQIKLGSRYSSMSVMNANVGGAGGSDGTEGITLMKTALQALLAGDGFIAKEGAEPLVDEKTTTIPAPLSPLPGQLYLLSHERVGFGSVAGGSIERRLVCLVCPRVRRHPALQKRAGEIAEGERCVCVVELHAPIAAQVVDTSLQCNIRKAMFTSFISNSSIANQNSSSSSSINGVGASSEVNQIFSYHRFPSARRSSSVNGTSSSSSVVASNFNSGSIDDHSITASLSTQHSQLGKIKGLPSSSYPVPSQSSSSSSLAIAPHQPSIRKQPPRVSVIERMKKSRGIQIATQLEQFRTVLEKARNEENQFLLALARQPVDPLSAAAASTL
ncbi:uncharacterized protein MONOS_15100 [Monocercomonoides exilis]|uniref:uncharacterized protein n=1 Tax=Monocercomonoides exilis TaxID=2049356 RepID=UPI0035594CB4|nr:hypothetical protein MONOS_15100 [Monocercomonoides exilis]|eukprot:MONOS_15100.1-p1 / transcript=MONOS_15100.1 / gene=MONOS_15100 / organism=Monocercomonoides_exilis_PA203 / gene_product=unspecified product / transcript_product=unspecified product / location=Mono_scaffold01144:4189-5271(+) / protein_length=330 / sequence_SO=supercontig / SO=protein_coding / is_pseudo=false